MAFDVASQNNAGVLNGTSSYPSISADGNVVAFFSFDPVTMHDQVYFKNETTSALTLLSQSSSGVTGNADSIDPAISADGSSVAFSSVATNLVAGAAAGNSEVYVKNPQTQGLQLVSQTQGGVVANATSEFPAISSNGSIVAFDSNASNLGLGGTGAVNEIYVKNLTTGTLTLVSQTSTGTIANGAGFADSITPDGNLVLFEDSATDLGSTNGFSQIYVKNVSTGALTIASQTATGVVGNAASVDGSISSDGLTAVFDSTATNLVAGATSGSSEVYEKNLATGAITLVSQKADGTIANGVSSKPVASIDGKYVMFQSTATNLDPAATNGTQQIYIKNLQTGALTLLSKDANGVAGNNASFTPFGNAQAFSSDESKAVFATTATNLANTTAGVEVVLRDSTLPPSVTINSVTSDNIINAAEAAAPVVFSGTSDQIGQTVEVDINTAGNKLGTATVQADGTWSLSASVSGLTQGTQTALATVQGASYLSATSTPQSFILDSVAPTLTFASVAFTDSGVQGDSITKSGAVTLSGTVSDNIGPATVEVFDGTTDLGAATVSGSTWTLAATLAAGSHSAFSAVATDEAGNKTTAANATSVTVDTTAPQVAFDQNVAFKSKTAATLTGTVSDNLGVTGVEIFDGATDLGAATVANGVWTLAAKLAAGDHNLTAVATDVAGNTTTSPASFFLQTGIKGAPYTTYEEDFDSAGNLTGEVFTKRGGAVYESDVVTNLQNGDHLIDYNAGTYFNTQNFSRETDLFDSSYNLLVDTLYNNDGTHSITGSANKQKLTSIGDDVMTGGGKAETFIFSKAPGQETITDFIASNPGHDTISLAKASFSNIAQVLQNLTQNGNDTVLDLGHHSSITIQNVTVATLQSNQQDFKLHA